MKIAIHNGKSWNKTFIKLCEKKEIPFIVVDCYDPEIIEILKNENITHLMWTFDMHTHKDLLLTRNVLFTAETMMNIKVFPDFNTCWHFDDKIAEKYLLEGAGGNVVPSWAFFEKSEAIKWLSEQANYPLVAKLRGGAGSSNVKLIKNFKEAKTYTKLMFDKGISPSPSYLKKDFNLRLKSNLKKGGWFGVIEKIKNLPLKIKADLSKAKGYHNEKGYVYFQKFIPDNKSDLRITVIDNRAFGFYRGVRKNDFRASGSGIIDYQTIIPKDVIKKSIELTKKLKVQSICYDYVKGIGEEYYIVEISYGFVSSAIYNCKGYWDYSLNFHEGHYLPEELILEDFLSK